MCCSFCFLWVDHLHNWSLSFWLVAKRFNIQRNSCYLQIVGEIKAARNALVEVTSRLRSHLYREFFQKDSTPPSISTSGSFAGAMGLDGSSPGRTPSARDSHAHAVSNPPMATYQNAQPMVAAQAPKVSFLFCIQKPNVSVCASWSIQRTRLEQALGFCYFFPNMSQLLWVGILALYLLRFMYYDVI